MSITQLHTSEIRVLQYAHDFCKLVDIRVSILFFFNLEVSKVWHRNSNFCKFLEFAINK